jgi:hypothetical protein
MKKIFYCEDEEEFYTVEFREKTIKIDWIKDGCFFFGCKYFDNMPLIINKEKNNIHCLKGWSEDDILLYPFQNGDPFYLRTATIEDVTNEIEDCAKWGVSDKYYRDILKQLTLGL